MSARSYAEAWRNGLHSDADWDRRLSRLSVGSSTGEHRRDDLSGSDGIETAHLAEAIKYRPRRQS